MARTTTSNAFAFGRNWLRFSAGLEEAGIRSATAALRGLLGVERLDGTTFLDVGCGSGLSSLAALRLGAMVTAFDADEDSVACTRTLLAERAPEGSSWSVHHGSVLDPVLAGRFGPHDVVHAWGVLHHTGAMSAALAAVATCVGPGGTLCIAVYNDAGRRSRFWARVKRGYVALPRPVRGVYAWTFIAAVEGRRALREALSGDLRSMLDRLTSRARTGHGLVPRLDRLDRWPPLRVRVDRGRPGPPRTARVPHRSGRGLGRHGVQRVRGDARRDGRVRVGRER